MLTIEECKKACKFAEGFNYHERSCASLTITYKNSCFEIEIDTLKHSANTEVYELFLQQVRRGINKYCMEYSIDVDEEFLELKDTYGELVGNYCLYDNDHNLELCIKYVLEKM